MEAITIYLTDLVKENQLSYHDSQIFLDYAYDLVLDGYSDLEIENIIKKDINHTLQEN